MSDVFYLCDGRDPKCNRSGCYKNGGTCQYTPDILHAKNMVPYSRDGSTVYFEEPEKPMLSDIFGDVHVESTILFDYEEPVED